jgi:hypothetical protein
MDQSGGSPKSPDLNDEKVDEVITKRYAEKLKSATTFNEIFDLVKSAVEAVLHLHRAGLTLILSELPNYIGAYHIVGSNVIVMNRPMLNAVEKIAKNKEESNSFVFTILTHEYLHSLGYMQERVVRPLDRLVCKKIFGEDHPATLMAMGDLFRIYPQLQFVPHNPKRDFEVIREFDKSSMSYIG